MKKRAAPVIHRQTVGMLLLALVVSVAAIQLRGVLRGQTSSLQYCTLSRSDGGPAEANTAGTLPNIFTTVLELQVTAACTLVLGSGNALVTPAKPDGQGAVYMVGTFTVNDMLDPDFPGIRRLRIVPGFVPGETITVRLREGLTWAFRHVEAMPTGVIPVVITQGESLPLGEFPPDARAELQIGGGDETGNARWIPLMGAAVEGLRVRQDDGVMTIFALESANPGLHMLRISTGQQYALTVLEREQPPEDSDPPPRRRTAAPGCGDGVCTENEAMVICADPPPGVDPDSGDYGCFPVCRADCSDDQEAGSESWLDRVSRETTDLLRRYSPFDGDREPQTASILPPSCALIDLRPGVREIGVVALGDETPRRLRLPNECSVFLINSDDVLPPDPGSQTGDDTFRVRRTAGGIDILAMPGTQGSRGEIVIDQVTYTLHADPPNDPNVGGFCCPYPGYGTSCAVAPPVSEGVAGEQVASHTLCDGGVWYAMHPGDTLRERDAQCNALCGSVAQQNAEIPPPPPKFYCNPSVPNVSELEKDFGFCRAVYADNDGQYLAPDVEDGEYELPYADSEATCEENCGYFYCVYVGDENRFGPRCVSGRQLIGNYPNLCVDDPARLGAFGYVQSDGNNRYLQPGFCAQVPRDELMRLANANPSRPYLMSLLWGTIAMPGEFADGGFAKLQNPDNAAGVAGAVPGCADVCGTGRTTVRW